MPEIEHQLTWFTFVQPCSPHVISKCHDIRRKLDNTFNKNNGVNNNPYRKKIIIRKIIIIIIIIIIKIILIIILIIIIIIA
jgi:uncharacterized membrane protein YvbJ